MAMRHLPTLIAPAAILLTTSLSLAGQDITLDQLPAPVRATVERETKGGQIKDIERDLERGQTIYEVEFMLDGQEYELDVSADGQLLERRLD
jgi:uncharacterized membrane protein YkoI